MGAAYGYVRVSTKDQNEERQIEAIKKYRPDIPLENIFVDKCTGKNYDRPNYNALKMLALNVIKAYSTETFKPEIEIIIEEMDRLGRTKKGVLEELKFFAENNIRVRILEIPTTLMDIDSQNDWVLDMINKILIEVYASLAEQEMEKRIKRQREGIELAKAAGKYKGRKPIKVDEKQFDNIYKHWKNHEFTAKRAMEMLNLKPNTFYKIVKQYEEKKGIKYIKDATED